MMEQEVLQTYDVDIEEGEVTDEGSDEVYIPLQRPSSTSATNKTDSPLATCHQLQSALAETAGNENDGSSASSVTSSSDEESDNCLNKALTETDAVKTKRKHKKRVKRTVMVRVQPTNDQEKKSRFKKYNIWTAALQEEALTENMRGCDVTRTAYNDRNVENYDYSFKYRLNGENTLKRRLSNSTDEEAPHPLSKRRRSSAEAKVGKHAGKSRSRTRYNKHDRRHRAARNTSGSDNSAEPRFIEDLDDITGRNPEAVAQEMANKLYEEKDELLLRIVEVLGLDIPIEVYKETQRIEADGGMLVMHGDRRRTPGGVFLFLLKKHDKITNEQSKAIFSTEKQNLHKIRKEQETLLRNKKVEELKKRLSEQDSELASLSSRKELFLLGAELNSDHQSGNLSNPPPSPVGHEQSPEYKAHAINHVICEATMEAQTPTTSTTGTSTAAKDTDVKDLVAYDDDFLDVHCGDMDFF